MTTGRLVDRGRVEKRAEQRDVPEAPKHARVVPRIGAQVSAAGGASKAVERATTIGAAAVQLFVDQQRRYPRAPLPLDELRRLRDSLAATALPAYVHVPYLVNLATDDPTLRERSVDMVCRALSACAVGGMLGAVVHVGSHRGRGFAAVREQVIGDLREACVRADAPEALLIENAAGGGGQIGAQLGEIRDLIDALEAAGIRAKLCLDLQHAHAAGADLASERGVTAFARALRDAGLARRVGLVHANDSAAPSGSHRDRHANPGEGTIGAPGLRACARVPELAAVPWVLECPGTDRKGATKREIDRLRRIVSG